MNNIKVIILLFFTTFLYSNTLKIDNSVLALDLLSHSSIYIDKTNNLTIKEIKNKNILFNENNKSLLGYGYSPDFTVWIKFTLENTTNQIVKKLLEYDNTLTTNIVFYDGKDIYRDGLLDINKNRKTINPVFDISLDPHKSKTYYLKLSSTTTALIVKLKLWNNKTFYLKEIQYQFALALFLGSMCILLIYNLFIYFFTQDKSYLYYVLYIFGMIIHHLVYVGIAFIYFLEPEWIMYIVKSAPLIVALPIFGLAMFTKHFLNIAKYSRINKILNILLILMSISVVVFVFTDMFDEYRNVLSVITSIYLIYITIYSAMKKNKQAYFILLGRFIIFLAFIFMFLSSQGIFSIYDHVLYFIEIAFVSEAVIFSIALSDKINKLQLEKNNANEKLFLQQKNEKERLEIKVDEKTNDLKVALEEKDLLLKELNHRVKNNMQTIVSLIRLQSDQIEDSKYVDILKTIQNRISAMSHLHEMLYQREHLSHINTSEYFIMLVDELQDSFDSQIEVKLDISVDLKIEQAIYCGLIFNELVTNSFKYAFPDKKGTITVKLYTEDNKTNLIISDNGIGYDQSIKTHSLGLLLINTLVKKQFNGNVAIESTDGVKVKISWYAEYI